MIDTIKRLAQTYGPSGHEDQIRAAIEAEIDGLADEVEVDALGNLIAWRRPGDSAKKPLRVMLTAHMDEIGLVVSHVEKNGFLRFTNLGGIRLSTLPGNRVQFADGTQGAIGNEPITGSKIPPMTELYIDVDDGDGEHNITPGDAAGMVRDVVVRGNRIMGKSLDDRVGCAILIEVMRRLQKTPHEIAFVFAVQEEVGSRGAQTAAYAIGPDFGLAVDLTITGDTPKYTPTRVELGKGPAIKVQDASMIVPQEVRDFLEKSAKGARVPYQMEILTTPGVFTDGRALQLSRAGVPSGVISIPARYVHSTNETVDMRDVENTVKLVLRVLQRPIKL